MKKVLLLALVLVFALSTFVCAAPATAFVDVPANDPSYGYVQQLIKDGVITDTDGAFNGNKTLTRYEMAAFVAKAIKSVNNTSAANKVLIQKLAVEFEAQLEEMNVRLTAMETKAAAVQGWFSPTMPKFSGEFSIAYNNGLKNYYAPYVSGTGTWVDNQANVFELDLNFNGSLSTAYNMSYHGGFAVTANYLQKFNTHKPNSKFLIKLFSIPSLQPLNLSTFQLKTYLPTTPLVILSMMICVSGVIRLVSQKGAKPIASMHSISVTDANFSFQRASLNVR